MNINREICDKNYTTEQLDLKPQCSYDEKMIKLRLDLIKKYGAGKDALDLCCGTGSYMIPVLDSVGSVVGIDFSPSMLNGYRKNLGGVIPAKLNLIEGDAMSLPFAGSSFDMVFAYTALYVVPDLGKTIQEIERVLRPGGVAVLELGNLISLNTIVANIQHRELGWAKIYPVTYCRMKSMMRRAGLKTRRVISFQILPMYGTPRGLRLLSPLLSPRWKSVMGITIGGMMADNIISGFPLLRHLAFRHIFIVEKNRKSE